MADEATSEPRAESAGRTAPASGIAALKAKRQANKKPAAEKAGQPADDTAGDGGPGRVHRQAPKPLHPKSAAASKPAEAGATERDPGPEDRGTEIPAQTGTSPGAAEQAVHSVTPDGSEIASVVSIAEGSEAADRGAVQSASAARTSGEIDDASASTSPGTGVDRAENAALGTAQRTEARAEASAGEGEAAQGSGGSSEEGVGTRASLGTLMTTSAATTAGSSSPAVSTWDQYMSPPAQNLVRAEDVLDQRYITREPLNASIPVVLDIPHRMELLKVVSGINQLPPADLVAVAMDWFLRGGAASPDAMQEPWNTYVGPGTPEDTPRAEDVLQRRFIKREGLKWQTPEELKLNQRLAVYRVMNRLKVPAADIVAVGIDRWLRVMGF